MSTANNRRFGTRTLAAFHDVGVSGAPVVMTVWTWRRSSGHHIPDFRGADKSSLSDPAVLTRK